MPRFFFDIHDGEVFAPDRQGVELEGLDAAQEEARKALRDIIWDEMPAGDRRDFTAALMIALLKSGCGLTDSICSK